jgi:hypothetical protein
MVFCLSLALNIFKFFTRRFFFVTLLVSTYLGSTVPSCPSGQRVLPLAKARRLRHGGGTGLGVEAF